MRASHLAAAVVAATLLLGPAGARAQEQGQDEVTLKNGGTVRGTVVSSEPGTSVKIIELGQTQVRVIPWSQVSDVEKGKYAPQAPAQPGPTGPGYGAAPPPPPQPVAPPPARMGTPGVVRLHIDVPIPTTVVEERSAVVGTLVGAYDGGYGGAYGAPYGSYGLVMTSTRRVCTSPCDTVVDGSGGRYFRLQSDEYPLPGAFTFGSMTGDVTMTIEPGSKGMRVGGVLGIVLGAIATVTGALMIPLAQTATVTDLHTHIDVSVPDRGVRNAGIGVLAGGLALFGGGVGLYIAGATHMRIEPRGGSAGRTARVTPRYWLGEF